jgi:hypothetical protein
MTAPDEDRTTVVSRFYQFMRIHWTVGAISAATVVIVRTDWPDSRLAMWMHGGSVVEVLLALWLGSFLFRMRKLNAAERGGQSKDVQAIINDEWARALRVRAMVMARVAMLFAQIPLAFLFGVLSPNVNRWRAVVGMGVANAALIVVVPGMLVLYFDREPRDD